MLVGQHLKSKLGQVDCLPTGSQPDPTEALDVGPPTSKAHKMNFLSEWKKEKYCYMIELKQYKMFQLLG